MSIWRLEILTHRLGNEQKGITNGHDKLLLYYFISEYTLNVHPDNNVMDDSAV